MPPQGAMNTILATQFDRIPVFDGGALILAELRALREDMELQHEGMNQQLDEIKQRLHAA